MSTATVAPSIAANAATVFPTRQADHDSPEDQRLAAEQALTDLDHAVQRIAERLTDLERAAQTVPEPFFGPTRRPRLTIPRRSRRSAWLPSN